MTRRTLTMAIQRFDRTDALHTRIVHVDDVLVLHTMPGTSVKGIIDGTFDIAEMPLAHYSFLRDRGDPYTAIPVFPDRLFVQQYSYARADSGITSPRDLPGRRLLLPMYWMTASFWHRGLLKDNFGIAPNQVTWHTTSVERDPRMRPPAGVKVVHSPGPHLGMERLLDGTAEVLFTEGRPLVPAGRERDLVPLYQDVASVQREWFRKTRFHPIVHVIVLRKSVVEERPEIITELCEAFDRAKASAYRLLQNDRITSLPLIRTYLDETVDLFGADPWPYGLDNRNAAELDQFLAYAHDQGFHERKLTHADLFDEPARSFTFRSTMVPGADIGSLESLRGFLPDARS